MFELENLIIENPNENNVVRFQLEPFSDQFIFLKSIVSNKAYAYKVKCYYKFYPD